MTLNLKCQCHKKTKIPCVKCTMESVKMMREIMAQATIDDNNNLGQIVYGGRFAPYHSINPELGVHYIFDCYSGEPSKIYDPEVCPYCTKENREDK